MYNPHMNNNNQTAKTEAAKKNTEKVSNSEAKFVMFRDTDDKFSTWLGPFSIYDGKVECRDLSGAAYGGTYKLGVDAFVVVRKRETIVRETWEVI